MPHTEFNLSLLGIQNGAEAGLKVPYCATITAFSNNCLCLQRLVMSASQRESVIYLSGLLLLTEGPGCLVTLSLHQSTHLIHLYIHLSHISIYLCIYLSCIDLSMYLPRLTTSSIYLPNIYLIFLSNLSINLTCHTSIYTSIYLCLSHLSINLSYISMYLPRLSNYLIYRSSIYISTSSIYLSLSHISMYLPHLSIYLVYIYIYLPHLSISYISTSSIYLIYIYLIYLPIYLSLSHISIYVSTSSIYLLHLSTYLPSPHPSIILLKKRRLSALCIPHKLSSRCCASNCPSPSSQFFFLSLPFLPPSYLELVLLVFGALVKRPVVSEPPDVIELVEALDVVRHAVPLQHVLALWDGRDGVDLQV